MAKFASYFVIGGLEASSGLIEEENSLRSDLADNPLERSYKPTILRHLPDTSSWSNYNPEALARLILPNGLRFCTDKEIRTLNPKSHSFVLTQETGEKCYGVSLVFYEEVKDINIFRVFSLETSAWNDWRVESNETMLADLPIRNRFGSQRRAYCHIKNH